MTAARSVAVFGGSEPAAGDPVYELARELGELLARRGFQVVTGGYGGVMEAASRGARDGGGESLGVTCDIFAGRGGPNRFVTRERREPDLLLRTRTLIDAAHGFVVLPGRSGTLAELATLWALHRAGVLGPRPVVLLGAPWEGLMAHLEGRGLLEPGRGAVTRLAATAQEAVDLVALALESWEEFQAGGAHG